MERGWLVGTALAAVSGLSTFDAAAQPPVGSIAFDQTTDSIQVANNSTLATTATIEARIFFPSGSGGGGMIFNEWVGFLEDKQISVSIGSPGSFSGYFHFVQAGTVLTATPTIAVDTWYHVAFVYEEAAAAGTEARLYLDGTLVAQMGASGDIGDSASGLPYLGSICRDGGRVNSFLGFMDTFRLSNVARYTGNFSAPTGDLTSDANTIVLYNFSPGDIFDDSGVTKVNDLSANNSDGAFGQGCEGHTSPTIGQEPTVTATATATLSPTSTPTVTLTPTSTLSPTETLSPTSTLTPTVTATHTATSSPTLTGTPTNTATATATRTPTNTPSPSATVDVSVPTSPPAIPALSPGLLIVLALGLGGFALFALRRR